MSKKVSSWTSNAVRLVPLIQMDPFSIIRERNLLSNKNKPVNSDNVFYSVCDMADITIDKKYSMPEWSVFAKNLKPHERKLLVPDGKNYIIVK